MAMPPLGPARSSDTSRLDVGIVSAGRVGTTLGRALARAGHHVTAVSGVSRASRDRAARLLPQAAVLPVDEVAARAQLLIVAVPDDAIADLITGLAHGGHLQPGQLVAHTCGAHGAQVLRPAAERGALTMSLHPVMTFTGRDEDLDRMHGVSFGVTTDPALRPVAEALVMEMGGEPQFVAETDRPRYHAALSHGANHMSTLINDALDLLRGAGIDHPDRMLAPLLSAALDNTLRLGDRALTGPIVRGDCGTVAAHLATLADNAVVDSYRAMARRTADRAIDAGRLSVATAEPLLEILAEPAPGTEPKGDRT